jgi:hypothetical protein
MAVASSSIWLREDVPSKLTVKAGEPRSINDIPDEIMLKILSYFGPEDLCIIAKVCKRWNDLAKDVTLWKKLSYSCDGGDDISRVEQVRCVELLGFGGN